MSNSYWKYFVCLIAFVATVPVSQAQVKEAVPVSRTIKISDEPRTIDPEFVLPAKLTQKVTVEFKEWSLQEFTQWLAKTIEMPVILEIVTLNKSGISELDLVSDHAQDEPVYLLLQRVIDSLLNPVAYYIEDDILYITTQEQAEENQYTETYNLAKYIDAGFTADAITDVIFNSTNYDSWIDTSDSGGTIQILGDIMLVRNAQNIQMEIKAILKVLLKPGKQTFLMMPKAHLGFIDQLDQSVSIDAVNQPLVKVVADLSEQTKLPIRLDRKTLHDVGVSFRKPITLKLKNIKLGIILKTLITEEPTTWVVQNGVILITTKLAANDMIHTAVYDVRDLCRDENEAKALEEAMIDQTSGDWEREGGFGTITFPKPGVMVIRQTMEVQREILELLTIYRKALLASKPRKQEQEDPNKIITHYYKMRAEMAASLIQLLPVLVEPDSWKNDKARIYLVNSKPEILKINSQGKVDQSTKKQGETTQLTFEAPQAVLLIKQTKKNHERINDIIKRVENGDGVFGARQFEGAAGGGGGGFGFGQGGQGGGGGFGGGFFSLPAE